MAEFQVVAHISEVAEGGQLYVNLDGTELLVCRHQGAYYAIAYYCSHAEFGLEGGDMKNGCITCPYHGAEFRLDTGEVAAPPAFEAIRTYPLKVENDTIAVSLGG